MTGPELDPRYSFASFVVGSTNRLAAAAAMRVAEAPGKAYNPLFIYGASGLGKTHLLMAIGQHASRLSGGLGLLFDSAERALQRLAADPGAASAWRLLLLDNVQVLGGDRRSQEALLSWWDELWRRGAQIVLAGDRPPTEIESLDHRLLSRFGAGLVADIAPPDTDMRVTLVRRHAADRGHTLEPGVAQAIARVALANVREIHGAVNRVIASQESTGRPVRERDVPALLGRAVDHSDSEEFDAFYAEIAGAVAEIATRVTPEQRLVDAILRFEGEGFRTYRLELALRELPDDAEVIDIVDRFTADVDRLGAIINEIAMLDPAAPELARADLLKDPERVLEAEMLLSQVHARLEPLPEPAPGPGLNELDLPADSPALCAARSLVGQPAGQTSPLYVRGDFGTGKSRLLEAIAREIRREVPMLPIAWLRAPELAKELAQARRTRQDDAWRARYRRARALIIDDFDRLDADETVREEFFHLFDGVRRAGGVLVLAGKADPVARPGGDRLAGLAAQSEVADMTADGARRRAPGSEAGRTTEPRDAWFLDPERALDRWPYVEDWLVMDLD